MIDVEALVQYIAASLGEYAHKADCELLIEPDSDETECDCALSADLSEIFNGDSYVRAAFCTSNTAESPR